MTTARNRRGRWAAVLLIGAAVLALSVLQGGSADGATASATKTVRIAGFAFNPQALRIDRGGRVAFANGSNVAHTATSGGSFDTRRIAPGKTKVVQLNRRGTFAYHCKIHPSMKGKIVVG
jgi:plastocyanin